MRLAESSACSIPRGFNSRDSSAEFRQQRICELPDGVAGNLVVCPVGRPPPCRLLVLPRSATPRVSRVSPRLLLSTSHTVIRPYVCTFYPHAIWRLFPPEVNHRIRGFPQSIESTIVFLTARDRLSERLTLTLSFSGSSFPRNNIFSRQNANIKLFRGIVLRANYSSDERSDEREINIVALEMLSCTGNESSYICAHAHVCIDC